MLIFHYQNKSQDKMSLQAPLLSFDQIDELTAMIHGIADINKKKLDDVLNELVDLENTSILSLYKIVCEEWNKKQKIVDNLCHFTLSMMASIQLLWEQKYQHQQRLISAEQLIESLQREVYDLTDQIQSFKQSSIEAQMRIQFLSAEKERIEELYRLQSCPSLHEVPCQLHPSADKICSACDQDHFEKKQTEIFLQGSKIVMEKIQEIQQLRNEKRQLETKLEAMIEQSELAKMEIELAEIAIKDALTYKTSYKSLIESNSQITLRNTNNQNTDIFNGQLECQSNMNDSFNFQRHNSLAKEFICHEDLAHFASTPCFLLNDSIEKDSKDGSHLSDQSIEDLRLNKAFQKKQCCNGHPKLLAGENEKYYWWNKSYAGQINANEIIDKFQIKKSEITKRTDSEQSFTSSSQGTISNSKVEKCKHQQENNPEEQTSLNKLLKLFSSKIVTNRIKKR